MLFVCRFPQAFIDAPIVHLEYFICVITFEQIALLHMGGGGGPVEKVILFGGPNDQRQLKNFRNVPLGDVVIFLRNKVGPYASHPQIWEAQSLVIFPPPLNIPQPPPSYESTMQVATEGVGSDAYSITEEEQFSSNSSEADDEEEDDDVFITDA